MALEQNTYSAADVLHYLLSNGAINLDEVACSMKKAEKEKILAQHPYPITQGKDGRWRTYVKKEEGGRKQIAKSTYDKVLDTLIRIYKGEGTSSAQSEITVEFLYPIWREYKMLHGAASTYIKRIDSDWRTFYEGTAITKVPIKDLNKLKMDIWAHELIQRVKNSKKQYYNISMIMRQILDYAVDAEYIQQNPLQKVNIDARMVFRHEKKKPSYMQVFTVEEVEALYQAAWDDFLDNRMTIHKLSPLAVMFQFQTGIRIGELCAVRYEDIEDSEIFIDRMFRYEANEIVEYTKGKGEGRYVPLTSEAKMLIAAAREFQHERGMSEAGYIFSVNDEPLSYYSVRKRYEKYCKVIGTYNKSSHKSRMTYVSALIDGGVNINTVREIAGHADEKTTYRNYCYDRKTNPERIALIEQALS